MAAPAHAQLALRLYHHVALPRDVPGHEEKNIHTINSELLSRLVRAVKGIAHFLPDGDRPAVDSVRLALDTAKSLNVDGNINKHVLIKELQCLESRHFLILFVTEQNACVLIYRQTSASSGNDNVIFEVFETSATCENVLASTSALQWDFPGHSVSVPYKVFYEEAFQNTLATFLEQASIESVKLFSAVTLKADAPLPEIRDTTRPALISGLLMSILEANGSVHRPKILRKRVRDTVSFKNAHKPWRRSPFYLALRVSMQRQLYQELGAEVGRLYYKTIMCLFLSHFLDDSRFLLPHEASHLLRMKLSRRLAKLEVDRNRIYGAKAQHDHLFGTLRAVFDTSLRTVSQWLERQWETHKANTLRPILTLPFFAPPEALRLQLPLSGRYLNRVFHEQLIGSQIHFQLPPELLGGLQMPYAENKPYAAIYKSNLALFKYEEDNVLPVLAGIDLATEPSIRCIQLADTIKSYVSTIGDSYDKYPDLKSKMILHLMELWVAMDQCATASYHLLGKFHPCFNSEMLNDLQLVSRNDMERLKSVQSYISRRAQTRAGDGYMTNRTIFDTPTDDCFAVRYYDESQRLKDIRQQIELDAAQAEEDKKKEWEKKRIEHEGLIQQVAELSCIYVQELNERGETVIVHKKGCRKHRLKWQAKQINIEIFEQPLPKFEPAAKAAVFELACPKDFATYRDASWIILNTIAYAAKETLDHVPLSLRSYSELQNYIDRESEPIVSLGSSTKSHLDSHYATTGFPVPWDQVCRPCGLRLRYYDSHGNTWTTREEPPSFAHHFSLPLPKASPYHSLQLSCDKWPSSNRIIANQTKCPSDLNVHEFMAWQSLLVGTHCRWLSLLRELGSTNLNFSTDSTWAVVSRLVHQVGPATIEDALRDVHCVFNDSIFCQKLLDQVEPRLDTIRRNWREPAQMDTLISILIKIASLAPDTKVQHRTINLLETARNITRDWQDRLHSAGADQGCEPSIFDIWAPVLCKRASYTLLERRKYMDSESLRYLIVSSIHLQNNLSGEFDTLPYNLRNAVLKDLYTAYTIRNAMADAIMDDGETLLKSIKDIWRVADDTGVDMCLTEGWFALNLTSKVHLGSVVHYNIISGVLLINGQQMGVLPWEFRRWSIIETLFGTRRLQSLPSSLPGMSLVLFSVMPNDHVIHLGFRGKELVIRAQHQGTFLEFIPADIFDNTETFDLPAGLVCNCYHWLDLKTGILVARQDNPWKSKPSNWSINIHTQLAKRRNFTLVDPCSKLYKAVCWNFKLFEDARHITVFQPQKGHLAVWLKRLELAFYVNRSGMLQSDQLGAVISKHQDPGTWYGLRSMVVIRSIQNPSQRSVLIPLGCFFFARDNQHVRIRIQTDLVGSYLRFGINDVLGRIECPAEPRLLLTKALLHAYTSHFFPDSLTGRTGVEEALYHLSTGLYQPWTVLPAAGVTSLIELAKLSPSRVYYPPTLKCMETVHWNENLSIHIQDDRYRGVVERMLQRLSDLSLFASSGENDSPISALLPTGNAHLETRAMSRAYTQSAIKDNIYRSRDVYDADIPRSNATELAKLLAAWPSNLSNTPQLATLLQHFPIIGGYQREFDRIQLTDILTVDLGLDWGALAQTSIKSNKSDRFRLMVLFSTMAFSAEINMDLIRVLLAYAMIDDLKTLEPPEHPSYVKLKIEEVPTAEQIAGLIEGAKISFTPPGQTTSTQCGQRVIQRIAHENQAKAECIKFAQSILAQWPSRELDSSRLVDTDDAVFNADLALQLLHPEWTRITQNFEFSKYLDEVQLILTRHGEKCAGKSSGGDLDRNSTECQGITPSQLYPTRLRGGEIPTLQVLLQNPVPHFDANLQSGPESNPAGSTNNRKKVAHNIAPLHHIRELRSLVADMEHSPSAVQRRYGKELEMSIQALVQHNAELKEALDPFDPIKLSNQTFHAKQVVKTVFEHICKALQKDDPRFKWLQHTGMWPSMTPVTLLTQLRSTSGAEFGTGTKEVLVKYGLALTTYQRFLRIQDASWKQEKQQLDDERSNIGHQNWSPLENVDWLLLEIEGDIMIREEQVEVARATISPASDENSVLQLLMGKGKTSCILPMVALSLANKQQLVRIVVPRPLLLQSAQVLQAKIGGILDREVMHLAFSRNTSTDRATIQTYCQLHNTIKKRSGVLLALPEHILSFKLSGLQLLCDCELEAASTMIKAHEWLLKYSRDIMDECDVSIAVKTQLIYPSGTQSSVDGNPLRWQGIQTVLRLIRSYLPELQRSFPRSIEVVERTGGGYPLIYFLRADAENHLISSIVDAISEGRTSILPSAEYSSQEKSDVKEFISSPRVSVEVVKRINHMFKDAAHLIKVVYLLRGLLVHRILLSTLRKRWNVQYGLHPERDPIAVPYLAKGIPSPTSEWGHPDVAIILTCLSFYYGGLNISQFKQAFEQLLKSDEPGMEYEKWAPMDLPGSLRDYHSITVEDDAQLQELHHHIRLNSYLLDFYLDNFVFPRHARQFESKLQASGWDLVLYDLKRKTNNQTTGFSGTNDSRHQLPMTIKQNDLKQLCHTNAEVLCYLLADRNRYYVHMVDHNRRRLSEEGLLERLSSTGLRILIDAGAQILEHGNRSLAKRWLKIDHEAPAAVFFDFNHRPWVVSNKGKEMPLSASPYADDLKDCLLYLDESHCRGTDLKLPTNGRAALTLGPQLTKDALAQAAMRLRLLGKSQSVTFFSPPEVHQSILDTRSGDRRWHSIDSSDVIRWLLRQSCNAIEQMEPLYLSQGNDYIQKLQTQLNNPDFLDDNKSRDEYLSIVRSDELQTLKQLYEPKHLQRGFEQKVSEFAPTLKKYVEALQQRRKDFQDSGLAVHSSALEEVEVEREIQYEVENVREVQKQMYFVPLKFPGLHRDIEDFIMSGRLPTNSDAYQPMPFVLQKTSLGLKHGTISAATKPSNLYISTHFTRTVKVTEANDNYLRPCQWVIWSCSTETALVVCPEEADLLIPLLRRERSGCHLIVYAPPLTRRMLHFNSMDYYAIPPLPYGFQAPVWLRIQLGIFAGRLYFDWDEYRPMLEYLGVGPATIDSNSAVTQWEEFAKKPLTLLHDWLAVRRKGQDFEHTPMGHVTSGKALTSDHPFFLVPADEKDKDLMVATSLPVNDQVEDEDSDVSDDEHEGRFYDAEEFKELHVEDYNTHDFDEKNHNFFKGADADEKAMMGAD